MIFEQLNPHACRTYLIGNPEKQSAVLVDPVIDHLNDYIQLLEERGLRLTHVIDTHTHADHISAGPSLKDMTDCAYVMHVNAPSQCVTDRVREGDVLDLNGMLFDVLHTPGHTRDSISLIGQGMLLTGDFLFLDDAGAGRDDLPGGNPAEHWESLNKLNGLSEELIVYPAHEYRNRKPSSLGAQKNSNPHLQQRSKEAFVKYLEDLRLGPADWMKDVLKANYACAKDPKAAWIPVDTPACEIKGTMEKGVNEIQVQTLTPPELKQKLGAGRVVLIDVREPHELLGPVGKIENAINIPIGQLIDRLEEVDIHKDKEIITVCRSGARAMTAAQILKKAEFENVVVLEGGMLAWNQA